MSPAAVATLQKSRVTDLFVLGAMGALAALGVLYGPRLHMPGSSILYALVPIALGRSLAPRRFGGTGASVAAVALAGVLGGHAGAGAIASLILAGPALDLALERFPRGGLAIVLVGVATSLAALAMRAASGPIRAPLPFALASYVACGAVAGVVAAAVWRARRS
jgi:hypothetical protein